jgi:hypothetical protein
VGAWLLDKWETTDPSGNKFYPLGSNARGVIIYADKGYMSVNIINPDWIDDIPTGLSLAATAAGECSFFAYSGPYTIEDGTVEHRIDLCTRADRHGAETALLGLGEPPRHPIGEGIRGRRDGPERARVDEGLNPDLPM